MEILSRKLNSLTQSNVYKFHPRCKKISLTHLMFADDLLVFSKSDKASLRAVKDALQIFHSWSGLSINFEKSNIYFGGGIDAYKYQMAEEIGIPVGSLPFKYLGIPLDSHSLRTSAYDHIIDKMTAKVRSWETRFLSFAGRLVLVKHVLTYICSYWMRILLLPQNIIKKVNAICRDFLWSGSNGTNKRLVKWKDVCLSKDEGGLGIRNLKIFNVALNLSQIWDICLQKTSIWVKWIHSYFITNRNFWEIEDKRHMSWQLKRILRLKNSARACINIAENGDIVWKGMDNKFTVKGSYNLLMGENAKRPWASWIWNEISPPKHSFCAWLAIQNKLRTKDRMSWLLTSDLRCCWCNQAPETNQHIFFNCPDMQVLKPILAAAGFTFSGESWQDWTRWRELTDSRIKGEREIISFLSNAATYELWHNRNYYIFRDTNIGSSDAQAKIWKMLWLKIHSLKHKKKWSSLTIMQIQRYQPQQNA